MEEKTVSLDDAMNLATAHMSQDNHRVAEMILKDILQAYPEHGKANYLMGLAHYFMSDAESGLAHIKIALNDDEPEAEWWSNYGIILTETGRIEDAIPALETAIKIDPDYADAYWNKAQSHWFLGQYEEAEAVARAGLAVKDDIPEAWLNLGAALVSQGKRDEAIEAWEKALALRPDFVLALNNIGNALREGGELEASAQKCREALALDPEYPEALNNLANALMDLGQLAESEEYYRKATTARPNYAEAHNNLALNLIKQSRFQEAIQSSRVALSYRPDYTEALLALSVACRAIGLFDEAEKAVQRAVVLKPESAEVRIDLADLLFIKDRYGDAEIELERARVLKPDSPRLYLKLAEVLERGNKVEEALEAVDKAVELNPEMPDAFWKKGSICHIANRIPEAKEYFDQAIAMRPDFAGLHLAQAELYLTTGETDKAQECVEKARELAPNAPSLFMTLSKVKKFTDKDADFQKMVELEAQGDALGLEQSSILNFALYSACEQIGDYDQAFEHLVKAGALKRKMIPYNFEQQQLAFQQIQSAYTPATLKKFAGKGCGSDVPVFIVGMPRSGTTLTEQIISSHADVYGAGELAEITMMERKFGALNPDNAKEQGQWYVDEVKKRDDTGKAKRITDKMPGNFANMGKIVSILPNAKIIHTRRNPIDTCLSCFKQNFARGQYWSYDLKELGQYYNMYLELMAYWRETLADKFIEIDYEETVSDLEPQARRLIDYVDLPWDEACLAPHKQKRAVLTASKQQVTKPVYKTSVQAWKRYEKQLEPLIESLSAGPAKDLLDL